MEGHLEDYVRHLLICIPSPVRTANLIIMLSKLLVLWESCWRRSRKSGGCQGQHPL